MTLARLQQDAWFHVRVDVSIDEPRDVRFSVDRHDGTGAVVGSRSIESLPYVRIALGIDVVPPSTFPANTFPIDTAYFIDNAIVYERK